MKVMCKCGNIEDFQTDINIKEYELKTCDKRKISLICKKCSKVVFIKLNNK